MQRREHRRAAARKRLANRSRSTTKPRTRSSLRQAFRRRRQSRLAPGGGTAPTSSSAAAASSVSDAWMPAQQRRQAWRQGVRHDDAVAGARHPQHVRGGDERLAAVTAGREPARRRGSTHQAAAAGQAPGRREVAGRDPPAPESAARGVETRVEVDVARDLIGPHQHAGRAQPAVLPRIEPRARATFERGEDVVQQGGIGQLDPPAAGATPGGLAGGGELQGRIEHQPRARRSSRAGRATTRC